MVETGKTFYIIACLKLDRITCFQITTHDGILINFKYKNFSMTQLVKKNIVQFTPNSCTFFVVATSTAFNLSTGTQVRFFAGSWKIDLVCQCTKLACSIARVKDLLVSLQKTWTYSRKLMRRENDKVCIHYL